MYVLYSVRLSSTVHVQLQERLQSEKKGAGQVTATYIYLPSSYVVYIGTYLPRWIAPPRLHTSLHGALRG